MTISVFDFSLQIGTYLIIVRMEIENQIILSRPFPCKYSQYVSKDTEHPISSTLPTTENILYLEIFVRADQDIDESNLSEWPFVF